MKIKVTVLGTLNLEKEDIKLLVKASAGEVLDTMRYQAMDLRVEIGEPKAQVELKGKVKGLKARIKTLLGGGEKPEDKKPEEK